MSFLDVIFPQDACGFCGEPIRYSPPWACKNCIQSLHLTIETSCQICGVPVDKANKLCGICGLYQTHPFRGIHLGLYSDILKMHIDRLRNEARRGLARPLGALLADKLNKVVKEAIVVPIPSYRLHSRLRGYQPSELLGYQTSKCLGLPYKQILACGEIMPIESDDLYEQVGFLNKAFWIRDIPGLQAKKVILIDDICRTGLTFRVISEKLLKSGASEVIGASVAVVKEVEGAGKLRNS